jgi:hypothetical protein
MKAGDVFAYVRFMTDDTVELKKFEPSTYFKDAVKNNLGLKEYKKKKSPMSYFYERYKEAKVHKRLIADVKSNLLV